MPRVILASASPRRKKLLEEAGVVCTVQKSDVAEDNPLSLSPEKLVVSLAERKAQAVAQKEPDAIVIGADTLVVLGDTVLGKPSTKADAQTTLRALSGNEHSVYTSFAVACEKTGKMISRAVETRARFRTLSDSEINEYIESGEPFDKAGAYAIQGGGAAFVASIVGDRNNVIGLPVADVLIALRSFGAVPTAAVVFDADGTLVDTTMLILKGFVETLTVSGYKKFADEELVLRSIGGSVAHTYARILSCTEDDSRIQPLVIAHDTVQDAHPEWIQSYPLVRETLEVLRERGVLLGLCTSGSVYQIRRNFSAVGIDVEKTFHAIVTADDHVASKPSPEGALLTLERLGVAPHDAAYVGDHDVDIRAAHAADMPLAIGISHGFHSEEELLKSGAEMVIHRLDELVSIILAQ